MCPSCTTKRMAATAAHLVDSVIPRVPMRQWVLALPKRLRPALRNHAALATRVLRIFIGSRVGREPAQLHRADSAGCAWWNSRVLQFGALI